MGHTPFGQSQIIFSNKERLALFQSHQQGNMTQYIHEKKPNSGLSTQSLLKRGILTRIFGEPRNAVKSTYQVNWASPSTNLYLSARDIFPTYGLYLIKHSCDRKRCFNSIS